MSSADDIFWKALYHIPKEILKDILRSASDYTFERERAKFVSAWKAIPYSQKCSVLIDYYRNRVSLFSYPTYRGSVSMPLLVMPAWSELSEDKLRMKFAHQETPFKRSRKQNRFLHLYQHLRRETGRPMITNGMIFRLCQIQTTDELLELSFEEGRFQDATSCQYILEAELVHQLFNGRNALRYRDKVAHDFEQIMAFFANNVARIGVSTLVLLRTDRDHYIPLIQRRGLHSMGLEDLYDTVPSSVFDTVTTILADQELRHKMLVEFFAELFNKNELESQTNRTDPHWFYKENGIREIDRILKQDPTSFHVTGFCIDLIRLVPEITCLLLIRQPRYYQEYYQKFRLSPEHTPATPVIIEKKISDLEDFLSHQMSDTSPIAFDPSLWTLPAAFCFYQGLRRAIDSRLLS